MDRDGAPPLAVPLPPPEHLHNLPNAATAALKPGPGDTILNQDGGGGADQKNLPMKNFRTLLFKFIKPLTPSDESLIEQRLRDFFPAIHSVPDHPPYAAMIRRAIEELNKEGGSSEEAISEFIKSEYSHLPWAHPTLLAHHLHKLSEGGELVITCDQCYILRSAIINTTSNPIPIHSPRPNLIPKYSPCSTAFSSPCSSPISSPCSSPSFSPSSSPSFSPCSSPTSSSSDCPTAKRRLNLGRGRGRPRKWIQESGRGRPHKVDESAEECKLNEKRREIQKRGRGRPRTSGQGRGRGRPRKKAETEEGYQLKKQDQTDVADDQRMTKDENQPVGLEAAPKFKEHSQVADMQVEEIKGNNVIEGHECQVILVQNREEQQSITIGIEAQGRGAAEEWENRQKQENGINEVHIALEEQRNGLEENKKPEEQIEDIIDQNPPWKQEDRVIQDQQEGPEMYITNQQDVVMIRSEAQDDRFFEGWSGKQKQEKGTIAEQTQSEDHKVIEEQNESIDQHAEVIELQDEQRKMDFEVDEQQYQEEKQENGVVQEEVPLEFEVAEGQCQKEELKSELVQVEVQTEYKVVEGQDPGKELQNEVVLEEFQLDDKVVEEKQDVQMNISEQQRDVDVDEWNEEKELGKSGSGKQNQSEAQENDAFQELILPQKRHMDGLIENVQQCRKQEKKILEQDQLHNQKVEIPEELHQPEEHPVEMFQEEIQLEEEVLEEQRDIVMIRSEAVEHSVVERSTGQVKQVKGDTVDQNEWEDQQNDAIGEQVQAQQIFMVGIREKFQSCEQEEIEEQDHLVKPEAEVPESLHKQDEQPNEECSIDGTFEEQEDLGTIISEAEEGGYTEEWSEEQKNEKRVRAEVNQSEAHENVSEGQTQAQELCIAENKEKIQACELHKILIIELKDRQEQVIDREQHQEEELQVETFEKRNQMQEKVNVVSSERLQSLGVSGKESTALLCKSSWSLVEKERDEYLDRFRDQEMKSPCQKREIPSSKWVQKQPELPRLESSTKCNQALQDRVLDEPLHPQVQLSQSEPATTARVAEILLSENLQPDDGGKGRSPELKVCAPYVEGMRLRSRIAKAVATSENQHGKGQPLRRSPRNLTADLEAAAKIEDLKHLKYPVKHPGRGRLPMPNVAATDKVLRSGKRLKKARR